MIEICKKHDCVGCGACISACSKDAIFMHPDSLGFLYPVIDQKKCVDCGLCVKSCFNNHGPAYVEPIETCVGNALAAEERVSSTSGGLASVFMRAILNNGGCVYGCSGENAHEVKHVKIENINDVNKLKGSKYVQSFMGLTYNSVVLDLKANRTVLFIGTPCQVAGLKAYLRGKEYDNLFTVDFVCHGVPSQQILNDAIDAKVADTGNLRLVNRVKEGCKESKYTLRLLKGGKIVYDQAYPSMGYITGFLSGLYYRENCYQCQFARRERVSDITLGDFWDRHDNVKGLNNKKDGLSMIMVNTGNGKKLMSMCKDSCELVEWDYEDFIKRNGQLKQPIRRHPKRDQFEELYCSKGFQSAIKESLRVDLNRIRKIILFNLIDSTLSTIPIIKIIYKQLKSIK